MRISDWSSDVCSSDLARLSPIHGNGVFTTEAIEKGERIVRYKGMLRTHDEVDEEYGDEDENGHTFLFTLNDDYVIDANAEGNIARWINRSEENTSELQSLMRISYAVICLNKNTT